MKTPFKELISIFLLLFISSSVYAESYKFISAPTHSKQQTKALYTPLIKYLSEKTGKEIELIFPINFLDYINKMRRGKYDITFDGPHFASWRIKNLGDTAIARFPGAIKIAIITKEEHATLNTMNDLIGRRVCGFSSPNLLTMAYLDYYTNPIQIPVIVPTKGFKGVVKCLKSGKGKAAILRDKIWNKINKTGLKLISIPENSYPDRTFTVSNRINETTRLTIQKALLSEEAKGHITKLLKTFKKTNLIHTNNDEYIDVDKLLKPIRAFRKR